MLATAALAHVGVTAAALRTIDEFALQAGSRHQGVALAGAAVALGVLLGLWYPRRLIRRRLRGGAHAPRDGESPVVDALFAALLSAVLALALALAIGLSLLAAGGAEGWRATIVRNLLLPPTGAFALAIAPLFTSVALLAAVCTTLVFALMGWHRAVTWPATSVATLWLAMIAASALSGVAVLAAGSLRLAGFIALAAPLAAAITAALQTRGARAPAELAREPITLRAVRAPVAAAAVVGAASFAALLASIPAPAGSGAERAARCAMFGAALLAGTATGRRALTWRLAPPPQITFAFALIAVVTAGLAVAFARRDASLAAPIAASVTAFASVAALVQCGRIISSRLGPPQHSVVWVGGSVAAGCLVAVSLSLVVTRAAPLTGVGLSPEYRILMSGLNDVTTRLAGLDSRPASTNMWGVDLAGPRADAIHVHDPNSAGWDGMSDRQRRRAMHRLDRALLPGGRIVFETDDPRLAALAGRVLNRPVWRIGMSRPPGHQLDVFIVGDDAPEWIGLRCGGTEWTATAERIR